ncbi:hypothetical protein JCM8547_003046 [Rhodosporidiobolus lusitaniae]
MSASCGPCMALFGTCARCADFYLPTMITPFPPSLASPLLFISRRRSIPTLARVGVRSLSIPTAKIDPLSNLDFDLDSTVPPTTVDEARSNGIIAPLSPLQAHNIRQIALYQALAPPPPSQPPSPFPAHPASIPYPLQPAFFPPSAKIASSLSHPAYGQQQQHADSATAFPSNPTSPQTWQSGFEGLNLGQISPYAVSGLASPSIPLYQHGAAIGSVPEPFPPAAPNSTWSSFLPPTSTTFSALPSAFSPLPQPPPVLPPTSLSSPFVSPLPSYAPHSSTFSHISPAAPTSFLPPPSVIPTTGPGSGFQLVPHTHPPSASTSTFSFPSPASAVDSPASSSSSSTPVHSRTTSLRWAAGSRAGRSSPADAEEWSEAEEGEEGIASGSGSKESTGQKPRELMTAEEIEDDRRRRNTEASARFRARKKARAQQLRQTGEALRTQVAALEREKESLTNENRWLRQIASQQAGFSFGPPRGGGAAGSNRSRTQTQ